MSKQGVKEVLLMPRLGSFELYTEVREGAPNVGPVSNFCWRDKRYPAGRGPFVSLWSCMEDFKLSAAAAKQPLVTPALLAVIGPSIKRSSVVLVDFKAKKRM